MTKEDICLHEKFKASFKSWISFEKRIVLFRSIKKFHLSHTLI